MAAPYQSSIQSFFGGKYESDSSCKRKFSESSKPNINNDISSKNKKYDGEKRERKFIESWRNEFPWVIFKADKNVMKCSICCKYPNVAARNKKHAFVDGCSNFRIQYLRSHQASDSHLECEAYFRSDSRDLDADRPTSDSQKQCASVILKAFTQLNEQTLKRLDTLFIAAFQVASRGKPLLDYEANLDLLECSGLDIGTKYRNRKACGEFIKAISDCLRMTFIQEVEKCNFLSILSDGSTETAVMEQETVFIRYVSQGVPVSFHAGTVQLEHCHADGVLAGIKSATTSCGIDFDKLTNSEESGPKLVCVNFDGASVMMGSKGGVAAKIKTDANHVIPIHCVAHKLELCVLDAVKHLSNLASFEDTLKQFFKFYHYSPKMRREVKAVADIFNTELVHLSDVKQVRWLASKIRAVNALRTSYHSILIHIDAVATGRGEQSAKAKGWIKKLKSFSFLKTMFVLMDVLPILTDVSHVFQREDLLVVEVSQELEGLILRLIDCKMEPENKENMQHFLHSVSIEDSSFEGVKLTGCPKEPLDFRSDPFLLSLVDGVVTYLEKRFKCFEESPLKSFNIFNFHAWPKDREALSVFGKDEINDITKHYSAFFGEVEKAQILQEFTDLKGYIRAQVSNCAASASLFDVYSRLLCPISKPAKYVHILKLVELLFVLSPATAVCERMFSSMNIVKTHQRSVLSQEHLQATLTIMTHGPAHLADFKPRPSVLQWIKSADRGRHMLALQRDLKTPSSQSETVSTALLARPSPAN